MSKSSSPIIQAKELLEMYRKENLVIVDAGSGDIVKESFQRNHLENALYVDLNTDLSSIKEDASMGGRHPLPTPEQFSKTLSNLGITEDNHIVIYDTQKGANAASRFWWMLRSAGHKKVQVLSGGQQEAEKVGIPVSSTVVKRTKQGHYNIKKWNLPLTYIDEVEEASKSEEQIIIDVRSPERYHGFEEPLDLIAGHIPHAINIPFTENLDERGLFKSADILRNQYKNVFNEVPEEHIIVHCGSGVTACHTLLAIAYAGFKIPKLYVGSWSEWSRNHKEMILKQEGKS